MGQAMPQDRPGDFVQALMDLSATICRPKKPACASCPLQGQCLAHASGGPEAFPTAKPRRERPHKHGIAYWTERGGQVWLVRRPAKGLLGGMVALPSCEWTDAPAAAVNSLGEIRHVFTHFSLDLQIAIASEQVGEGWWHPLEQLDEAGLPTLFRKAAAMALARDIRDAA